MDAFDVRTLAQIEQEAALARTLERFKRVVLCVSETRIQDPNSVVTFRGPDIESFTGFTFRVSGDPVSSSRGQSDVEIVHSMLAKRALLDWITANYYICTVRLNNSVCANSNRLKHCYLFVVSAYVPTYCSSPEAKDKFYQELSELPFRVRSTDVDVAGGLITQLVCLRETEGHNVSG